MKNVLITGAGRGIGKACVYEFAKRGYRVFLNYNKSESEAYKIKNETGAIPVKCDITKAAEIENMKNIIHDSFGKIDTLINNAGIAQQKLFTDITEQEWDNMFNVNIKGMFMVTKAFIKDMINNKKGSIVNISSMWGITGGSCEVHYSASKAAVIGFTKALAKEVGPSGVRVNCVAPGVIKTDMNSHLTEEDYKMLCEETPLLRIGSVQEAASAIAFLSENEFITGQVLSVNGGIVI